MRRPAPANRKILGIVGDEIDRIARIVRRSAAIHIHRPGEASVSRSISNKVITDVLMLVDRQSATHEQPW